MVIVVRKVIVMAIFLMFKQLSAVLLATFLTIFSLSIHIAARPFEDVGTDWTEMFSLVAQLITLVAGPAFVVLVRMLHPFPLRKVHLWFCGLQCQCAVSFVCTERP